MSALSDTQQAFQQYLLTSDPGIVDRIAGGAQTDPARRLRIYHDAYRLRLIEALGTDYEALRTLLGPEEFKTVMRAYVEATPSTYRNVRWYGSDLARFLRDTPPWSQRPLNHELALFEWTLTLAFDAADAPVVRFEDLAQLRAEHWPSLKIELHPSVHVIALRTNAPSFRKASDAGTPLPAPSIAEAPIPWLVWRKDLGVSFRSLSEPEAWGLNAVREGADFSALCEGICEWLDADQAPAQAAQLLRQWVEDAVISRVKSEE
jgi:hypothetical protein